MFRSYASQYQVFNRVHFYEVLNGYIEREFPVPVTKERLFTAGRSRGRITGSRRIDPNAPIVSDPQVFPAVTRDFKLVQSECPRCKVAEQLFQEYEVYIARLEAIIREGLGEVALPRRPQKLGRRRAS